jgi:Asp/Glu/hydantoin racemase
VTTKLNATSRLTKATLDPETTQVHNTVIEMIGLLGQLRKTVAIDQMPLELQNIRIELKKLDERLEQAKRKPGIIRR